MATKWGIVSTGKISNDFVLCLRGLPSSEHQIVAVAARNVENAKKFATHHSIPTAHNSYNDLAQDPNIEIVYIGNLNPGHFRISKMMLEAGKHVLCEKPLCMDLKETEELIECAKKNKRFLLEAIWSRFFPIYEKLRNEISLGTIGPPNLVNVTFAFSGCHIDRNIKKELGASVVLDIGIYTIQLATLVFGTEKPVKITAKGFLNKEGVDEFAIIILEYSNDRCANLTMSFRNVGYNEAVISGPLGILRIPPPFHAPTVLETPKERIEIDLPHVKGSFNYSNSQGLTYQAMAARDCLQRGVLESPLLPLEETKLIAYIMTEVRRQLGSL